MIGIVIFSVAKYNNKVRANRHFSDETKEQLMSKVRVPLSYRPKSEWC